MKLNIAKTELQKRTLFVGTPMYAGQCYGLYANALLKLGITAAENELRFQFDALFAESNICRGRNTIVDAFLKTEFTHLLFIDSDIEFTVDAVLSLMVLADPKSDKDVVCGLYPKKGISWKKVAEAVKQDYEPHELEDFVGDLVLNLTGLEGSYSISDPLEVTECGTGFMMIQRHVLERFMAAYPERYYIADTGRTGYFFDNWVDPETHRLLTEDFNFCRLVRAMGGKVWVAPWINLNHLGYYKFKGNAAAVSSLLVTEPDVVPVAAAAGV